MATRVTATEAARRFSELLNRVRYQGESFDIVRNGEVVATMSGATPAARATMKELLERLETVAVDDAFAEDLEQVQNDQPSLPTDPWAT